MDVNLKFTDRLGICKGSKGRVRFAGLTTPKYLQMRCHAANPLSISFHEQWCSQWCSQHYAILAVVLAVVLTILAVVLAVVLTILAVVLAILAVVLAILL